MRWTADAQDLSVFGSLGEPRTKDSELQTPPGTACAGSGGLTQFILMHVVVCSLEAGQPRFVWQCGTWLFVAKKLLRRPVAAFTFLALASKPRVNALTVHGREPQSIVIAGLSMPMWLLRSRAPHVRSGEAAAYRRDVRKCVM